ncbi:MAG: hypothetical protein GY875_09045 [Gammaproteobacteria bacterium]|nr:hypothetical protein [Gammaproteobacteria bacterium]
MNHLSIIVLVSLLLAGVVYDVKAYELPVHARITNAAYQKSVLVDADFLDGLGIENAEDPFGVTYYDYNVSEGDVREWVQDTWDHEQNRMPDIKRTLSIEGWLMRGAIREDDYVAGQKFIGCSVPEKIRKARIRMVTI